MVRTSGGIRISAGKSSKKSGGGGTSNGGSRSTSTPSGKSSGKGSNRLPPIPHCEAPSWQKPITNFFISDAGSSKTEDAAIGSNEDAGCSSKNTDEILEKSEVWEKDSNKIEDEQLPAKSGKQEEKGKENEDSNISS